MPSREEVESTVVVGTILRTRHDAPTPNRLREVHEIAYRGEVWYARIRYVGSPGSCGPYSASELLHFHCWPPENALLEYPGMEGIPYFGYREEV